MLISSCLGGGGSTDQPTEAGSVESSSQSGVVPPPTEKTEEKGAGPISLPQEVKDLMIKEDIDPASVFPLKVGGIRFKSGEVAHPISVGTMTVQNREGSDIIFRYKAILDLVSQADFSVTPAEGLRLKPGDSGSFTFAFKCKGANQPVGVFNGSATVGAKEDTDDDGGSDVPGVSVTFSIKVTEPPPPPPVDDIVDRAGGSGGGGPGSSPNPTPPSVGSPGKKPRVEAPALSQFPVDLTEYMPAHIVLTTDGTNPVIAGSLKESPGQVRMVTYNGFTGAVLGVLNINFANMAGLDRTKTNYINNMVFVGNDRWLVWYSGMTSAGWKDFFLLINSRGEFQGRVSWDSKALFGANATFSPNQITTDGRGKFVIGGQVFDANNNTHQPVLLMYANPTAIPSVVKLGNASPDYLYMSGLASGVALVLDSFKYDSSGNLQNKFTGARLYFFDVNDVTSTIDISESEVSKNVPDPNSVRHAHLGQLWVFGDELIARIELELKEKDEGSNQYKHRSTEVVINPFSAALNSAKALGESVEDGDLLGAIGAWMLAAGTGKTGLIVHAPLK